MTKDELLNLIEEGITDVCIKELTPFDTDTSLKVGDVVHVVPNTIKPTGIDVITPKGFPAFMFFHQLDCVPANKGSNQHYQTKVQPIETMQANMTHEELIGFLKGNIIKYACRCGRKDEVKKETAKIKQYAQWLDDVANGKEIKVIHPVDTKVQPT